MSSRPGGHQPSASTSSPAAPGPSTSTRLGVPRGRTPAAGGSVAWRWALGVGGGAWVMAVVAGDAVGVADAAAGRALDGFLVEGVGARVGSARAPTDQRPARRTSADEEGPPGRPAGVVEPSRPQCRRDAERRAVRARAAAPPERARMPAPSPSGNAVESSSAAKSVWTTTGTHRGRRRRRGDGRRRCRSGRRRDLERVDRDVLAVGGLAEHPRPRSLRVTRVDEEAEVEEQRWSGCPGPGGREGVVYPAGEVQSDGALRRQLRRRELEGCEELVAGGVDEEVALATALDRRSALAPRSIVTNPSGRVTDPVKGLSDTRVPTFDHQAVGDAGVEGGRGRLRSVGCGFSDPELAGELGLLRGGPRGRGGDGGRDEGEAPQESGAGDGAGSGRHVFPHQVRQDGPNWVTRGRYSRCRRVSVARNDHQGLPTCRSGGSPDDVPARRVAGVRSRGTAQTTQFPT